MRHPYFLAALMIVTSPVIAAGHGNQGKGDVCPTRTAPTTSDGCPDCQPAKFQSTSPRSTIATRSSAGLRLQTASARTTHSSGSARTACATWAHCRGMRAWSLRISTTRERSSVTPRTSRPVKPWPLYGPAEEGRARLIPRWVVSTASRPASIDPGRLSARARPTLAQFHAFLRERNGDVVDLGAFADGSGSSDATAVNDRGQVVGTRVDGRDPGWIPVGCAQWNSARDRRRPAVFFLFPHDINNRGEVVGDILGTEPGRAFRWTRARDCRILGTLSGLDTHFATARAINSGAPLSEEVRRHRATCTDSCGAGKPECAISMTLD